MSARVWKLLGWSSCLAGALLALAGLWGIAIYVWGVVDVWGEPDKSWIFCKRCATPTFHDGAGPMILAGHGTGSF
jgi:hypothetical protein